jgi:hypothetical protein
MKSASADDIMAFVSEMDCRHIYRQKIVAAVEQFNPTSPEFDELLAENGATKIATGWHLVPSASLTKVLDGIYNKWDLPWSGKQEKQ